MHRSPFMLTKWYFDCVAADGRAVIGYWASLAWRGIALIWQNVTLYEVDRPPISRSSLLPASRPEMTGDAIRCDMPALDCKVHIESRQPIEERLFASERGIVDWRAEAPEQPAGCRRRQKTRFHDFVQFSLTRRF